jgi:2-oxoglutarate ferredoxin oxidoreductase subunit gamma
MKILFAGEGGQGVQVAAEILAKAGFIEGKKVTYIPNFGVEQRGGVSLAFVTIDEKPIVYPKFETADVLAVFSDRSLERIKGYLGPKTKLIKGPMVRDGLKSSIPAKIGNLVVLSAVNKIIKVIKIENIIKAMEERFSKQFEKNPELKKLETQALLSFK